MTSDAVAAEKAYQRLKNTGGFGIPNVKLKTKIRKNINFCF